MLNELSKLVDKLNETNSILDKKDVLKQFPSCKTLLKYVYSPYTQFNVSSKNLIKRSDLVEDTDLTIIQLLDQLNNRDITGHKAISVVNGFIQKNPEHVNLIYNIIDKNLKTRTDAKLINAVFPGTVPEFNIALANKYEDQEAKIDFAEQAWLASRKLDGVRCLAIPQGGTYKLVSRQGKEFLTLNNIVSDLEKLNMKDHVFDGEVCLVDENGNEDFQSVVTEIRRKDHTIAKPKYKIFDLIKKSDFESGKSKDTFSKRLNNLNNIDISELECLDIVQQIPIKSKEHLVEMMDSAVQEGWEGLIIRKDTPYKGKRSNDLLKVKKMHDAEYTVESIVSGPIRILNKETGQEVEEVMLARVNITHKGNTVGVGSGFSLEQRKYFHSHPEDIIGKTITVKYFEETQDKNGNYSLRFPIIKHIYEETRDL